MGLGRVRKLNGGGTTAPSSTSEPTRPSRLSSITAPPVLAHVVQRL